MLGQIIGTAVGGGLLRMSDGLPWWADLIGWVAGTSIIVMVGADLVRRGRPG